MFGLLAAVLGGYSYGVSDHFEQLPLIMRAMDSRYLINDFFVNAASEFGPRFYYVHFMALIGKLIPLPLTFLLVFLFAHVAVAIVTAFAARDVTGSTTAGMIAVVLVALMAPFTLGAPADVHDSLLRPSFLVFPFSLYALWQCVRGEPVKAAAASVPAMLVHPVIGIEVVAIALASATAHRVSVLWPLTAEKVLHRARDLGLAFLIVALATLLWIVPAILSGLTTGLETEEFLEILVYFRHPHRLVMSNRPIHEFLLMAAFGLAVVITLVESRRFGVRVETRVAMGAAIVVIGVMLFAGWFFVEVVPTRLAATAWTWRMSQVLAWLGWILIAGVAADLIARRQWGWAGLFLLSATRAPALLLSTLITTAVRRLSGGILLSSLTFFVPLMLLTVAVWVVSRHFSLARYYVAELPPIIFGLSIVLLTTKGRRVALAAMVTLGIVLLLAITNAGLERFDDLPSLRRLRDVSALVAGPKPVFTVDEAMRRCDCEDIVSLAAAARRLTHPDAVFLIPRQWQQWRLFAERAVVVDHKAFIYSDEGMKEWYDRLQAIYYEGPGYPDGGVTDVEVLGLQRAYGFHYAVLPLGADTSFAAISAAVDWKLVQVAPFTDAQ